MYATVNTMQLKPADVAAFTQQWQEQIEPGVNAIATMVDLYVLVNAERHTVLIVSIYADEATALACEQSLAYQDLFAPLAHLVNLEPVTQLGYTVISR